MEDNRTPPKQRYSLTPLDQMSIESNSENKGIRKPTFTPKKIEEDVAALNINATFEAPKSVEDLIFELFKTPDKDEISVQKFFSVLSSNGLRRSDPRFQEMIQNFREQDRERSIRSHEDHDIMHLNVSREAFKKCVAPAMTLVVKALQCQLIIPEWSNFCREIGDIYEKCKPIKDGSNATYIPQLARMNPNYWAVAVCTVDGQRHAWGDSKIPFCVQSVGKAFNYATSLNDLGADFVHKYVGQEPSGRLFNEICLNHNMQPHNPMINAGAIQVCGLIRTKEPLAERFDWMMKMYGKFAGGEHIGFSNQTFLSERETADRNFALAYFMREYKCFPEGASLQETLDLYFQLCSMETTCDSLSVMAATLANGGICPITGERVVSNRACRDTLSLMHSCGMYDYSGQWAFQVGLPAKSGVSGAIAVVIPNQMGIAMFSPPIDRMGNSVKGIAFCKHLVERFNFHNYDSILNSDHQKIDPRRRQTELQGEQVVYVLFAAKTGDVNAMKQYAMRGLGLDMQDYDGRTATHIAASEGHLNILEFLRHHGNVNPSPRDRWNRTPLDDSRQFGHTTCTAFLEDWIASYKNNKLSISGRSSNSD